MAAGSIKLVVRDKQSGKIGPRKRGRAPADVEIGYLADSQFHSGSPRKRRQRRGRKAALNVSSNGAGGPGRKPKAVGIGEIEMIVQREVPSRLSRAKQAAVEALEKALG